MNVDKPTTRSSQRRPLPCRGLPRRRPSRAAPPLLAAALVALLCAGLVRLPQPATALSPQAEVFSVTRKPASLEQLQSQAAETHRQMKELQEQMEAVVQRAEAARVRLDAASTQLAATRLLLTAAQSDLDRQQALVSDRLAAIYKNRRYTWMDALANVSSFAQAETAVRMLQLVAEQDRRAETELERLTGEVDALAATVEAQRSEALAAQAEIDAERAALAQKLAERRALLKDLTARIETMLGYGPIPGARGGRYTQVTWAKALLQALNMPVTVQNVAAVTAWEMAEGGHWYNVAHYNPLNTTWRMPGATSMNSVGVKAYRSWEQGFQATILTLHNGLYGDILGALERGDDAQAVADAVAASPWGTNHFTVRS